MGNKPNIQLEDLKVGSEYWVASGNFSIEVISKQSDGVLVKTLSGNLFISFSEKRDQFVIEEY